MAGSARERLIGGAISLMRERGVAGTSINEILDRSKTARRSIYVNFPGGKAQLVEESARVAGQAMGTAIAHFTRSDDPGQTLEDFIAMWKEVLVASDYAVGCPIVAAAVAGAESPEVAGAAAEAFADWQTRISAQLQRAGRDAAVADSLANIVIAAVEGAVIMAQASHSVRALDDVGIHLGELVNLRRDDAKTSG